MSKLSVYQGLRAAGYKLAARIIIIFFNIILFAAIIVIVALTKQYLILLYLLTIPSLWLIYCLVFGHAETIVEGLPKKIEDKK